MFQLARKARTKMRSLCVSDYPLKVLQKRIDDLLKQIDLPNYVYGSIPGRSNILTAKQHVHNEYFFSVDLKNFFTNISHHQVFEMFRQNKFAPSVARTLTQLTTYKGAVPQGPPSSPTISNLVFVETGNRLFTIAEEHDITFTTYLDDLVFSSKKDFKLLIPSFLQIIRSQGFFLNHKKISYTIGRAEVTGVVIYANKLWPTPFMKEMAKNDQRRTAYINSIIAHNYR